jgi:hypothetical protein
MARALLEQRKERNGQRSDTPLHAKPPSYAGKAIVPAANGSRRLSVAFAAP